ncbi:MAG: YdcF family protein [Oscillospiraceae bacterium]|nr:YdcF family protein [Oscillospiraceae bacterium]
MMLLEILKKVSAFLLAAVVSLGSSEDYGTTSGRSANEIIQDMITYYGCYEDKAADKINDLKRELYAEDKQQGKLWDEIMDYWKYANSELTVNTERLPDDLPKDDTLCIIVLGFELNADGTMQKELVERLKVAKTCAKQYPDAPVICTGGGTAANRPNVTEAGLMGEWLLENGLSKKRLIIEDRSLTTAENACNTYNILLEKFPKVDSVVLISSSYHIPWGTLMFESAFMKSASEKNTPEIHVISNCSCPVTNDKYTLDNRILYETGGLLQLIGNDALADQYYYNWYTKPKL